MSISSGRLLGGKALSIKMNNSLNPTPPALGKAQNDELQKLNQDLTLLSQRFSDLQASSNGRANPSPFVSNIRDSTNSSITDSSENSYADLKLQILDKIITKMCEIDRIILRNTEHVTEEVKENGEPADKPVRRGSRGADLVSFPTHLHILDRLVDLHAKSQRVAVITKTGSQTPTIAPPAVDSSVPPPAIIAKMDMLEAKIKLLEGQLKSSEATIAGLRNDAKAADELHNSCKLDLIKEKDDNNHLYEYDACVC